ncbi:ABC transporter substrate-binding protein [Neorhizobium alkalisoli]|uniref:Peptide/nickel transport system substrate-binding protein n=1 Tax=Neorhizobium alkalisoli TaxID=528178 RepID=A0A561QNW4_9HYPH|nr:ABC transporter substrate-binding protein [Neorhizobium alkalisoli]TWF52115.1 peptide/nickel transport system substrate-binding protein [Neorhizobium alkalisoli]
MIHLRSKNLRALSAGVALSLIALAAPQAFAATPADTLVEGFAIDDIITLDPGEAFELSTAEVTANTYSKLVTLDPADTSKVIGDLAASWTISDDGMTYTFKLKPGLKFASGNPITAEDVAYSFERAVKLDKSPAFLLTQFGLKGDNVTEKAKATAPDTFVFNVDKAYAPSFVLNVLTATVASVVDKKVAVEHSKKVTPSADYKYETDFANEWLKTGFAGSGPFKAVTWRANEAVVLEANPNYYGEKPKLKRVIYRYMKESAGQRLALENGDIDVARNLEPGDLEAVAKKGLATTSAPKGTVYYFSLNQKNKNLAKPEVIEAFKYLVDYDAIGATLIKGIGEIHQTFLPKGQLGALDSNPYKLDVAKAKELLAKAGLKDGFTVTMDVRNTQPVTGIAESVQQTLAQAGIKLEIIPGDGKQTLTKFRARTHDIYIGQWGSDYFDPNSNAETFTINYDNSDEGKNKTLAWRNAWDVPKDLEDEAQGALLEKDAAKRAAIYEDLQKKVLAQSPFVVIFQQTEVAGYSSKLKGFKLGPSFDTNFVNTVSKD